MVHCLLLILGDVWSLLLSPLHLPRPEVAGRTLFPWLCVPMLTLSLIINNNSKKRIAEANLGVLGIEPGAASQLVSFPLWSLCIDEPCQL